MRSLVLFVLSLCFGTAFAQSQEEETIASVWTRGGVFYAQPQALCDAAVGGNYGSQPFVRLAFRGTEPGRALDCYRQAVGGGELIFATGAEQCPVATPPWVGDTVHGHCHRVLTCAGKAGQTKQTRITRGWARSNNPNTDDVVIELPFPEFPMCDGSCLVDNPSVVSAWRSQVPGTNGLHRLSTTFQVTYTGASCTGRPGPADPGAPTPPCPGILGQVNGRPVCIGSPASPLPTTPRPPGLPPDGPGNPPAGDVPATGPGSGDGPGSTPPSGNGGNAGGGSNAAVPGGGSEGNGQGTGTPVPIGADGRPVPGGGTGTGTNPDPAADPCGLPGSPPCKLDETGTPTGDGTYTSATNAVNANKDQAVQGINDAAGATGKATGWTFSFAFPTGCSPIPLAAFAPYMTGIDICAYQPMIHDLMSLAWLGVTVFLIIGMVGRAVGGGSQ